MSPRSRRLVFAFGIHDHQPVGNFGDVIHRAHDRAYAPFLRAAAAYADVHFSLHVSGSLVEWLADNAPATVALVRELVARGQCELLGGTYYEALAPVAPAADVQRSIVAFRDKLRATFGVAPTGMWLAERVYEPHLPALLADAGVTHLPLDDWHFRVAGYGAGTPARPCLVEYAGRTVTVLPISQRLRYMVPFAPVADVIRYLRGVYDSGGIFVCLADDGEKFGEWPGTYYHCYEEGWLGSFLGALAENAAWLNVVTLAEAAALVPAAGPAYLPATSYFEMTRWALPTGTQRRVEELGADFGADGVNGDLVPGAGFRAFFHKYPEVNYFHKRVQGLSARLERAGRRLGAGAEDARRSLWRAQANDSYWHGVFGGFYLPHLRRGVKEEFIRAEAACDKLAPPPAASRSDVDADGQDEIIIKNDRLVLVLKAGEGLAGVEFARREPPVLLTDVPGRRPEPYHDCLLQPSAAPGVETIHAPRAAKEEGLDGFLIYDRRPRRIFLERVFAADAVLASFTREAAAEYGPITWGEPGRSRGGWSAEGELEVPGVAAVEVTKKVALRERGIAVGYSLRGNVYAPFYFGTELSLSLRSADAAVVDGAAVYGCDAAFEGEPAGAWSVSDKLAAWRLALTSTKAGALWHTPLYTVSCSESGYEKVYQGSAFYYHWLVSPDGPAFAAEIEVVLD